ncbi:hypothetical protein M3J09_008825 [Ascochyta lentis]
MVSARNDAVDLIRCWRRRGSIRSQKYEKTLPDTPAASYRLAQDFCLQSIATHVNDDLQRDSDVSEVIVGHEWIVTGSCQLHRGPPQTSRPSKHHPVHKQRDDAISPRLRSLLRANQIGRTCPCQ